jgi:hypothetical protein
MRKRNSFIEQLRRKQQAAQPPPAKPISEMSEQELDQEEARLRTKIRNLREQGVDAGRETVEASSGTSSALADFLANRRKRRRPWK